MRKWRRTVARNKMKKAGITGINRQVKGCVSWFSKHWREWA